MLDRASRRWCGVDMNPANVQLLQQLRTDLRHHNRQEETDAEPVTRHTPA